VSYNGSNMDKEKLKKLGADWKALDDKYDNQIIALIDAQEPTLLTDEQLAMLGKMQEELFELEVELFKVLRGE
jgi:hypothetical protein